MMLFTFDPSCVGLIQLFLRKDSNESDTRTVHTYLERLCRKDFIAALWSITTVIYQTGL